MASKPPFVGEKIRIIDEVCSLESGKREKGGAREEGVPSLGGEHLTREGAVNWTSEKMKYISRDFYQKMKKGKIRPNDILVVKDGATTGKTAFVEHLPFEAAINEHIFLLRFDSPIRAKFVAFYLMSSMGQAKIASYYKGSAIGGIDRSFAQIEVPFFDEDTSAEIVQRLGLIRSLRCLLGAILNKYDQLIKSRFVEMFGNGQWAEKTVGDLATDIRYGTSKKASDSGAYKYLRMNNMTDSGVLTFEDLKYIDLEGEDLEKCQVIKGDLLFNRTNSRKKVGKTAVFLEDEPMVIAGYIIRVRLGEEMLSEYLSIFMNLPTTKTLLRTMAKGAVHQANINSQELASIKVPVPPIKLQRDFVEFIHQVDKSRFVVQQQIEKLQTLYDSLAQEYFGD